MMAGLMLCPRHGIAAGPDGRCALCHRRDRAGDDVVVRQVDRRIHRVLRLMIAIIACGTTYVLLMAWLDTTAPEPPRRSAIAAPAK
jgi:hypothetical protein